MNRRSNNSTIDWQELDRLVDGRLGDEAYRELLCQIDADPNGWKQCALAFLEHQALEKELLAFSQDPACQILPWMTDLQGASAGGRIEPEKAESASSRLSVAQSVLKQPLLGWMSMALCIVGGLALGFTLNHDFRDRLPSHDFASGMQGGLNNVSLEQASPAWAANPVRNDGQLAAGQQVHEPSTSKRARSSQRNRTSLINIKSRTQQSDHCRTDRCPEYDHWKRCK